MISAANGLGAGAVGQIDSQHEHASATPRIRLRVKEPAHHAVTEVRGRVALYKKLDAFGDVTLAIAVQQIQAL